MQKKPFFIRGLDEETIRTIKVMSAVNAKTIPQTIKYLVDFYNDSHRKKN